MRMIRRLLVTVVLFTITVVGLTAGSATADEAHGKGRSACHFSGLNDDPDEAFPFGGRVQSYGQLVRQGVKDQFPSPGVACNPNNEFEG